MDTSNDGEISQYINGDLPYANFESAIELKFYKNSGEMPPRTSLDALPILPSMRYSDTASFETDDRSSGTKSPQSNPFHLLAALETSLPLSKSQTSDGIEQSSSPVNIKSEELPTFSARRGDCRRRLDECADRLNAVRKKLRELLTMIITIDLPDSQNASNLPTILTTVASSIMGDETESSSDDNDDSPTSEFVSDVDERWFRSRAITTSCWHWLLTEMRRSEKVLKNLRALKSSYNKCKLSSRFQSEPEDDSCSRARPFSRNDDTCSSVHDLSSPKCARLVDGVCKCHDSSLLTCLVADPHVQCSCATKSTGPCVLCCGSSPQVMQKGTDLLTASRLYNHIHPKLSTPEDIPLSLRLESRLPADMNNIYPSRSTAMRFTHRSNKSKPLPVVQPEEYSSANYNRQNDPRSSPHLSMSSDPLVVFRNSREFSIQQYTGASTIRQLSDLESDYETDNNELGRYPYKRRMEEKTK